MVLDNRKLDERRMQMIRSFQKSIPENRRCFNCLEKGPQYVCLDFSTFVCTTCSGIHREFSHRVKSISMSTFTDSEVKNIVNFGGNEIAKKLWLAQYKDLDFRQPSSSEKGRIRDFVRMAFIDRKWVYASDRKQHSQRKKSSENNSIESLHQRSSQRSSENNRNETRQSDISSYDEKCNTTRKYDRMDSVRSLKPQISPESYDIPCLPKPHETYESNNIPTLSKPRVEEEYNNSPRSKNLLEFEENYSTTLLPVENNTMFEVNWEAFSNHNSSLGTVESNTTEFNPFGLSTNSQIVDSNNLLTPDPTVSTTFRTNNLLHSNPFDNIDNGSNMKSLDMDDLKVNPLESELKVSQIDIGQKLNQVDWNTNSIHHPQHVNNATMSGDPRGIYNRSESLGHTHRSRESGSLNTSVQRAHSFSAFDELVLPQQSSVGKEAMNSFSNITIPNPTTPSMNPSCQNITPLNSIRNPMNQFQGIHRQQYKSPNNQENCLIRGSYSLQGTMGISAAVTSESNQRDSMGLPELIPPHMMQRPDLHSVPSHQMMFDSNGRLSGVAPCQQKPHHSNYPISSSRMDVKDIPTNYCYTQNKGDIHKSSNQNGQTPKVGTYLVDSFASLSVMDIGVKPAPQSSISNETRKIQQTNNMSSIHRNNSMNSGNPFDMF